MSAISQVRAERLAIRKTKARDSPNNRANRACAGASFDPISDTKITLSMPSTISMPVSVASASQPDAVKIQAKSIIVSVDLRPLRPGAGTL